MNLAEKNSGIKESKRHVEGTARGKNECIPAVYIKVGVRGST